MFDLQSIGKTLVFIGFAIALLGALFWAGGRLGLGTLPGDVRIRGDAWGCLVPITTTIILSLLLTLIVNVVLRLLNR
jgi:low affinity Fe/Cu permease